MASKKYIDPVHPMQTIYFDEEGVARFKENKIVRFLLDAGPFDLNQIALMNFSREDREQLAQLIGYSVSGAGDLSYMSRETIAAADAVVDHMLQKRKKRKI